ncbi:MAG: hypothetical protein ISS10_02205 [Candidatus Marinimicrobia bacterium]|nr:hypothetical protein [Candidatus Neomarinimicrobiota bacterium]MBL7059791.1 hypothetical protein [Candidatus Neomarinimicrobiota bacterium]
MLTKPAVNKRWLLLVSGLLWSGVGIMLNTFAFRWVGQYHGMELFTVIFVGIVLGITIAKFGFRHIAKKNIQRINSLPERVCVFAFQAWKSYILILVMMSMGIFLRTSSLFPKILLSPMYIGIGTALFVSGLEYYLGYYRIEN